MITRRYNFLPIPCWNNEPFPCEERKVFLLHRNVILHKLDHHGYNRGWRTKRIKANGSQKWLEETVTHELV